MKSSGDRSFSTVTTKDSVDLTHQDIFSPHIVGQYDGRSKPLPEYHAKITGFDERVCICRRQMSNNGIIIHSA